MFVVEKKSVIVTASIHTRIIRRVDDLDGSSLVNPVPIISPSQ
jgi:hypothetical protein